MREILFRGKRIDNGEWVEGCFGQHTRLDAFIIVKPYPTNTGGWSALGFYEVDPATVGQYTGMVDMNGAKIFEGDIVDLECDPDRNELWVFDYGNCGGVQNVAHDVGYMGFCLRPLSDNAIKMRDFGQRDDPIYYLNTLRLRVVGNIHDDPELLGGQDGPEDVRHHGGAVRGPEQKAGDQGDQRSPVL